LLLPRLGGQQGQSRHFVSTTSTSASLSTPDIFRRRSERSKWANNE
jgi:hypothetical protein